MSATLISFPARPEAGATYVVGGADYADTSWAVYRQPAGAAEPDLVGLYPTLAAAVSAGREIARDNGDRFVVDEGVLR